MHCSLYGLSVEVSLVSDQAAEFDIVSKAELENAMRHAVDGSVAQLGAWERKSLPYHAVLSDRMLARVTGWALKTV